MDTIPVQFTYLTGLSRSIFHHVRLIGSWDQNGRYSDQWTSIPMHPAIAEDGCPCFIAIVQFDASQVDSHFHWGVILDAPAGREIWGIPTEVNDRHSTDRYRTFTLRTPNPNLLQQERYYLTDCRHLGAQKYYRPGQSQPALQFAVWAPHARSVEVVFGDDKSGYIADDGFGMDAQLGPFPMFRSEEGIWKTDIAISPELANFAHFNLQPYMFRVVKDDGQIAYRTDLYSRCQIGQGNINPNGQHYIGKYTELDGTKSCSVVVDPDTVMKQFQSSSFLQPEFVPQEVFWQDEFNPDRPVPKRVEDLV
ncbi:MAG TPA: hypothetical protein V6C65_36430, partial [Allocoleopsis sp.]